MIIEVDPKLCITHATDSDKVDRYALALTNGELFPPIRAIHSEGRYYITDGAHRVAAYARVGLKALLSVVDVMDASPQELSLLGRRGRRYV